MGKRMIKCLKRFLPVMMLGASAFAASAGQYDLSRAEADSVPHAMATILGQTSKTRMQQAGEKGGERYMEGCQEAIRLAAVDDARYQGLAEGVVMAHRLRQVEELGAFKLDFDKFARQINRVQDGKATGFTRDSADEYMNALIMRRSQANPPAPLSQQQADTVTRALATLWSGYLTSKAAKDGSAVSEEYMRGVHQALKMAQKADMRFLGFADGVAMAQRLRQLESVGGFKIDFDKFAYVLTRVPKGRRTGFSPASAENYINALVARIAEEEAIVAQSPVFLEEVAKREGIVKRPSGLLFEVITEGEGDMPGPRDAVLVRYSGSLINGKVFNKSMNEDDGTPFLVHETIPGFAEGLQLMKKGGKYRLYIPAAIGYGEEGVKGLIPGGAATIFDVEVLDIRHAPAEESVPESDNNDNNPSKK